MLYHQIHKQKQLWMVFKCNYYYYHFITIIIIVYNLIMMINLLLFRNYMNMRDANTGEILWASRRWTHHDMLDGIMEGLIIFMIIVSLLLFLLEYFQKFITFIIFNLL